MARKSKQNNGEDGQGNDLRDDHIKPNAFDENASQNINEIGERQKVADHLEEHRQG